jgi:hypothetical protein
MGFGGNRDFRKASTGERCFLETLTVQMVAMKNPERRNHGVLSLMTFYLPSVINKQRQNSVG